MIDKKEIEAFVEEGLTGSDCFVVDVQVKPDNVIVVEIDNEVKSETSKRKVEVEEDLAFGYDEVKYTKYLIRFK